MFAYPIIAEHVPDEGNGTSASATRSAARRLQLSTAGYIASNGFNLVDTNGNVTTWGRWSPADVHAYCAPCTQPNTNKHNGGWAYARLPCANATGEHLARVPHLEL